METVKKTALLLATRYAEYPRTALVVLVVVTLAVFMLSCLITHRDEMKGERALLKAVKAIRLRDITAYLGTVLWVVPLVAFLGFSIYLVEERMVERATELSGLERLLLGVSVDPDTKIKGFEPLLLNSYVVAICGIVMQLRNLIIPRLKKSGAAAGKWTSTLVRDLALMAGAAVLTVLATEVACDEDALTLPVQSYIFSFILIFALMLLVYFFFQRYGFFCAFIVVASIALGIAEHFVVLFKDQAMLPSDILSAGTAAAVAEGYEFTIAPCLYNAVSIGMVAITLLSFVSPVYTFNRRSVFVNFGINYLCGALVLALVVGVSNTYYVGDLLGFTLNQWWPISTYEEQGFIPSFTAAIQKMEIDEPEGYSDEATEELEANLAEQYDTGYGASEQRAQATAQFDQTKPCIVAVMNESFSDLSVLEPVLNAGYTGPSFYNSISDALQRGALSTSVLGGGTATTEWEFFTNNSSAFLNGKQPYELYSMAKIDNVVKQLKELGYGTTAIHPNAGINYRRNTVYAQFGFDEFLTIDDFDDDAPTYHNGVTDATTYDKVLEILRTEEDPQFIFDLTMQNHSGYEYGSVPEEDMTSYWIDGVDEETLTSLNVYLASIQHSDEDLEYFINELRTIERPVILVFFGDHQPGLSAEILAQACPEMDEQTRASLFGQTTYMIWANYDVAATEQVSYWEQAGANELSAVAFNLIGAPLSDYQKALLCTRGQIQALSLFGVLNTDGSRYVVSDETNPYYEALNEIARMQYYNFARKVN